MIAHETLKLNLANAIAADPEITALAVENFGRGLDVIVNRYGAQGFPGEKQAPFCFIYSDGENELGDVGERTFEIVVVVGGVDRSATPRVHRVAERTDEASGVVVYGIQAVLEEIREKVMKLAEKSVHGAIFNTATESENSLLDYPLEWSKARLNYYEPETLDKE